MIVRNEQHNLAACLEPVASLFDEMVIIDTGSHDDTISIARRYTTEVHQFPWCDDFSAARNESLRHAHGEWVFWLDADDRIGPDEVVKLDGLVSSLDDQPRAYFMDTVCRPRYACDGSRLISHARLFRRHRELHWHGRVHEQLRPDLSSLGYKLAWSDIRIEHVGYADAAIRQRKLQRDVRLLGMDYAVNPDDPSTLIHLGLAYAELGKNDAARKHLLPLLESQGPSDYRRRVFGVLGELSLREGKAEEAIGVLTDGLSCFPDDQHLRHLRAESLYEQDRFEAAERDLRAIVEGPDPHYQQGGVPVDIKRKLAPRKLADVLRVRGAYAEAEGVLQNVVVEFPLDTLSWYALGRVYADWNQAEKLQATIQRLAICPQGSVFAGLLLASWYLAKNALREAGSHIDQLISEVPQMPLPRLLRIDWLSRCGSPLEARMAACRDLLRVQPGNMEALREIDRLEHAQRTAQQVSLGDWCTSIVFGAGVPIGIGRS
jgi:tetratricopeptide (TPR) repeat protein